MRNLIIKCLSGLGFHLVGSPLRAVNNTYITIGAERMKGGSTILQFDLQVKWFMRVVIGTQYTSHDWVTWRLAFLKRQGSVVKVSRRSNKSHRRF